MSVYHLRWIIYKNQFLVVLILLSIEIHSYRTSFCKVIVNIVEIKKCQGKVSSLADCFKNCIIKQLLNQFFYIILRT